MAALRMAGLMAIPGRLPTPDRDPHIGVGTPAEEEHGPLRRCIVTRERGERERMLRFVVSPDRRLVPDLAARLPGRGIWLSARRDVVETARARGAFARAARGPVTVPDDLLAALRKELGRRIGERLGLARRAGQAVAGFARVRTWLVEGRAALLVEAADGSVAEGMRLRSGARAVPIIAPLPGSALGAIFGRDHVVHVAVARGQLAAALVAEAERLAGLGGADLGGMEASHGRFGQEQGVDSARIDARAGSAAGLDCERAGE